MTKHLLKKAVNQPRRKYGNRRCNMYGYVNWMLCQSFLPQTGGGWKGRTEEKTKARKACCFVSTLCINTKESGQPPSNLGVVEESRGSNAVRVARLTRASSEGENVPLRVKRRYRLQWAVRCCQRLLQWVHHIMKAGEKGLYRFWFCCTDAHSLALQSQVHLNNILGKRGHMTPV